LTVRNLKSLAIMMLASSVVLLSAFTKGANAQGFFSLSQLLAMSGTTGATDCREDPPGSGNFFFFVEFTTSGFVASSTPCSVGVPPSSPVTGGSANPSYGAVADMSIEAALAIGFSYPDLLDVEDDEEFEAEVQRARNRVLEENPVEIAKLKEKVAENNAEIRRLQGELDELARLERIIEIQDDEGLREIAEQERLEASGGPIVNAGIIAQLQENNAALNAEITDLQTQLLNNLGEEFNANAAAVGALNAQNAQTSQSNYAPLQKSSPGGPAGIAIGKIFNTPYTYGVGISSGVSGIASNFAFANRQAERPWALFLNTGIGGLDDKRTGADRKARIREIELGARMRLNPKTNVGIIGRFRDAEVTSAANGSKLTGDYYSLTLSGDRLINETVLLGLAATYTRGENTLTIGGGTGTFDVEVMSANASLSNTLRRNGYTITPGLSASISRTVRDSYTDSNAVFVPGSTRTSGNVNINTAISKTHRNVGNFTVFAPKVSFDAGYFFREDLDAALTSGATSEQLGFGANIAAHIDMQLNDGMEINIGTSYGFFQDNIQVWTLKAGLVKKF